MIKSRRASLWCDYEEVNTISIVIARLIEFQGQGIIPNAGNVFIDRGSNWIYNKIVNDNKFYYHCSPYQYIKLYKTKGCLKHAIFIENSFIAIFCELLVQYIIKDYLCCNCNSISIQDKNDLRETIKKYWKPFDRFKSIINLKNIYLGIVCDIYWPCFHVTAVNK